MIIISLSVILVFTLSVGLLIMWVWSDMLLDRMHQDLMTKDATVRAKCMVRVGVSFAPGIALINSDHLIIRDVSGRRADVPLADVTVRKARVLRRPPWLGKHVFVLTLPRFKRLSLGINRAESSQWTDLLKVGNRIG